MAILMVADPREMDGCFQASVQLTIKIFLTIVGVHLMTLGRQGRKYSKIH